MAVLTMTVGNTLALLQESVKRALAYSSIAHSGYILVAVLAGPAAGDGGALANGIAGVLFYLIAYAFSTIAAFAVLAALRARGEEARTYEDIAGLGRRHPGLAAIMLVSMISLIGLPPFAGFVGKIYLFAPAVEAGYLGLVVVGVLNSAISAVYYLRIAGTCYFSEPADHVEPAGEPGVRPGAAVAALLAVILGVSGGWLVGATHRASRGGGPLQAASVTETPEAPAPQASAADERR
jgi:NADH-quinone oxidoreductase subunit N